VQRDLIDPERLQIRQPLPIHLAVHIATENRLNGLDPHPHHTTDIGHGAVGQQPHHPFLIGSGAGMIGFVPGTALRARRLPLAVRAAVALEADLDLDLPSKGRQMLQLDGPVMAVELLGVPTAALAGGAGQGAFDFDDQPRRAFQTRAQDSHIRQVQGDRNLARHRNLCWLPLGVLAWHSHGGTSQTTISCGRPEKSHRAGHI